MQSPPPTDHSADTGSDRDRPDDLCALFPYLRVRPDIPQQALVIGLLATAELKLLKSEISGFIDRIRATMYALRIPSADHRAIAYNTQVLSRLLEYHRTRREMLDTLLERARQDPVVRECLDRAVADCRGQDRPVSDGLAHQLERLSKDITKSIKALERDMSTFRARFKAHRIPPLKYYVLARRTRRFIEVLDEVSRQIDLLLSRQ